MGLRCTCVSGFLHFFVGFILFFVHCWCHRKFKVRVHLSHELSVVFIILSDKLLLLT